MDVGRLTVAAAGRLGLRLRIVCMSCGHWHAFNAAALTGNNRPDTRLSTLPLTCSNCLRQDVLIAEYRPSLTDDPDLQVLTFHIEEWSDDDQYIVKLIAATDHAGVARAAFDAAVEAHPHRRIMLRQRSYLIKKHEPNEVS